nr:hypothetical protein [Tanacetum cinerariifolium]
VLRRLVVAKLVGALARGVKQVAVDVVVGVRIGVVERRHAADFEPGHVYLVQIRRVEADIGHGLGLENTEVVVELAGVEIALVLLVGGAQGWHTVGQVALGGPEAE